MDAAEVEEGGCIPWDRAFALAQGDSGFDPDQAVWLQKQNFMCLMKNARIAALFSFFNPRSGMLAIRAPDGSAVVGELGSNGDAFSWTQAGGIVSLGTLPGAGSGGSTATGASNDGSVVVGFSDSASGRRAFRWTQSGGMVSLGSLPGFAVASYGFGVSADGSVVV